MKLYRPGPLNIPPWLRTIMDRRWSQLLVIREPLRQQGFPALSVAPYEGCRWDEVVHSAPLPPNFERLLLDNQFQAEQLKEVLSQIGIELPEPAEPTIQ